MSESTDIILHPGHDRAPARCRRGDDHVGPPPAIIAAAGAGAEFAWNEFFKGQLANAHTRENYAHAVRHFLAWYDHSDRQIPLVRITPGHVGDYLAGLELGTPTKKLRLDALRKFFDLLVVRHVVILNPAASVRAGRYSTVEGKTPEIGTAQARDLLKSIDASDLVGLRDRAIIAVLIYTAAGVGAVAKLTFKSLRHDGTQYALRFSEKGGKVREIPVRHDLEQILRGYIEAAGITEGPLFRTAVRRMKQLTTKAMSGIDNCRMMKRRLKAAGLPGQFSPHSFRVATVTDLLGQSVPLEDVQHLAGHADPRTTLTYIRSRDRLSKSPAYVVKY
jgi:site-specific recombinase XerD